ncbi:replication terminator protein [Levilactobacillus namurensis]|uniref:replication terminator protein n=1 Tax=Levilactobacillus namurensis TaxID=380393 RepID=UPI001D32B5E2|nr:replication terminator protein [Levilactobacillus namurensis]HJE44447.1 replication terminator protein [Levilactobacillus namurensis]
MKKQHKLINVELSELANGAIQEKLDHALKDVMTNILDPNTEAKKKRKITITLTMEPGENRDTLTLDAQVKATLVPEDSATTTVLVGRNDAGYIEANELRSGAKGQTYFDPDDGKLKDDKGEDIAEVEKRDAEDKEDPKVIDFQGQRKAGN